MMLNIHLKKRCHQTSEGNIHTKEVNGKFIYAETRYRSYANKT